MHTRRVSKLSRGLALVVLLGLFPVVFADPSDAAVLWAPTPGTSWQIQFAGTFQPIEGVEVYDLDSVETDASRVTELHGLGAKVICYVNAGAWENWRADKDAFPASVKGKTLDGWPGERWLDIRNIAALGPIMEARMDVCVTKGFDGIEFDNVDGYQNKSGFPLTAHDQQTYNEWLATKAKERNLAPGLKNDLGQIDVLVDDFSFAINEECLQYRECGELQPFIDAGKAVFHIEYEGKFRRICSRAPDGFSTLKKKLSLNAYRRACS